MLVMKKEITLTGEIKIGDDVAEVYRAVIDSENPNDMTLTTIPRNKELRKANRTVVRENEKDFEDEAYAIQDTLIAEKSTE